jgi:hypothetical protein
MNVAKDSKLTKRVNPVPFMVVNDEWEAKVAYLS